MTTLLDAQALVAYLLGEPAEPDVKTLLRASDAAITAVNLAETVDIVIRKRGVAPGEARSALSLLIGARLRVIPTDEGHAWAAGVLRAEHYDRDRRPVSVADCILVAAAEETDRIATGDRAVIAVARAEGVAVVPLPDSGRRPE